LHHLLPPPLAVGVPGGFRNKAKRVLPYSGRLVLVLVLGLDEFFRFERKTVRRREVNKPNGDSAAKPKPNRLVFRRKGGEGIIDRFLKVIDCMDQQRDWRTHLLMR